MFPAAAVVLFVGAAALAFLQDVVGVAPGDATQGLINSIISALTLGGGLAVGGAFLLKRADKFLDARSALAAEERAEDRAREVRREAAQDALLARYLEREERFEARTQAQMDRYEQRTQAQIERLAGLFTAERDRSEALTVQVIERIMVRVSVGGVG